MYLDEIAAQIRRHVPSDRVPEGDAEALFRNYAILLRAKGDRVTQSDVHDAWAAWMVLRDSRHPSLVPYDRLDAGTRAQDAVFATAIRKALDDTAVGVSHAALFSELLLPAGPPIRDGASPSFLELYKMMVASSESLVSRRNAVNTFFLTMNGALLTAFGLIVQNSGGASLSVMAVGVLAFAGAILCAAWRSLIISFGQLNRGKFKVISAMERYLPAAIYAAEWEALGRGEDPAVYRSFTSREIWVPTALVVLHVLAAILAAAVLIGWLQVPVATMAR